MKVDARDRLLDIWSVSKAMTWAQCPRRFFLRYVQRLKLPSERDFAPVLRGRGVHAGQEHDNYAKLRGEALRVQDVLDCAVAAFEEEREREGVTGREAPTDGFAEEHRTQLERFEASGARGRIRPIEGMVEAHFEIDVVPHEARPFTAEGYVDVVSAREDGSRCVVDYKTGARAMTDKDAEGNSQLGLEALGAEAAAMQFVSFVAGRRQRPTAKATQEIPYSQEKAEATLGWMAAVVEEARRALKTGDFPRCSPQCFWCSPKACEFYRECYGPCKAAQTKVQTIRPVGTLPVADWRLSLAGRKEARRAADERSAS